MLCVTCICVAGPVLPLQQLLLLQKLPKRSAGRRQRKLAHLRNPGYSTLNSLQTAVDCRDILSNSSQSRLFLNLQSLTCWGIAPAVTLQGRESRDPCKIDSRREKGAHSCALVGEDEEEASQGGRQAGKAMLKGAASYIPGSDSGSVIGNGMHAWSCFGASCSYVFCLLQTNLYKLGKEIVREQQIEEVGGYEPQIRDRHRWDVNESIPGEQLRPGAFKMQLRPDEEAALPLVCPCAT